MGRPVAAAEVTGAEKPAAQRVSIRPSRSALAFGIVVVVVLGTLCGWFGHRGIQLQSVEARRDAYVEAARLGAVNMTSIDFQRADADVQRILDSSTGQFHDEFAGRAADFLDAAKKSQSTSVGEVVDAGVESMAADGATVLVAVSVKTSQVGTADLPVRSWRMRITVQRKDNDIKVSKVDFL